MYIRKIFNKLNDLKALFKLLSFGQEAYKQVLVQLKKYQCVHNKYFSNCSEKFHCAIQLYFTRDVEKYLLLLD